MRYAAVLLLTGMLAFSVSQAGGTHGYTGVKKCAMCHKGEAKGEMVEIWEKSKHSHAYEVLGTQAAKDVYTKLGKTGDPQTDNACLQCHVTAFGVDSALVGKVEMKDGVSCEVCHGPGADYAKMGVMKNKTEAIAAGLTEKPQDACVKCHNDKSPTAKPFVFADMWPKIAHKVPAKK